MGIESGRGAREELWRRYDAGGLTAGELDARLKAVDHAGADPVALTAAVEGALPRRHRDLTPLLAVLAVVAVVVIGGVIAMLRDDGGDDGRVIATNGTGQAGPLPIPLPAPIPECPEGDDAVAAVDAVGAETPPENPALLSGPAFLPEGYEVGDEDAIAPGSDNDAAFSLYAGDPPPVDILGRELVGPIDVSMRAFRYESVDAAAAAARGVARSGVCNFDAEAFSMPDRPEITGAVVRGPIPATAFAGFRQGDRRFVVAVPVGSEDAGDDDAVAQAIALAQLIAASELDAASTPPPPR